MEKQRILELIKEEVFLPNQRSLPPAIVKDKKLNVIHIEDNAIHFEVMLGEQYLHQLIHDLYKNNIKIADIHIEKPTLNDIFIKIARDEI